MLRSYRARFLLVHIGDPSSNQATTLESQMIHMIQELFGQTLRQTAGKDQPRRREAPPLLFRGAQMPDEAAVASVAQRTVEAGAGGTAAMADQLGHRRVAQHPSAIG